MKSTRATTHYRAAELKSALRPFRLKDNRRAMVLLASDATLLVVSTFFVIVAPLALKPLGALGTWIGIARLFILGHDACHRSLLNGHELNGLVGRLAFLPSLTPFSLWVVGHNLAHHGFQNLRGRDYVWAPMSRSEFERLDPGSRILYLLYRTPLGPLPYYALELWWKRLFFPSKRYVGSSRNVFRLDSALVLAFAFAWIASLSAGAVASNQSVPAVLLFGFVIPLMLWNWLIGFVVYIHHTNENVKWYTDRQAWARDNSRAARSVHVIFPRWISRALHNIMDHPAHHLDVTIPCYNLPAAQECLERMAPDLSISQRFTWSWYFESLRRCRYFDYERGSWER